MTREEAIKWLEETIQDTDIYWESCSEALQKELDEQKKVFLLALAALRPVSRERVEQVWRGCPECKPRCGLCIHMGAWDKYGKPYVCERCVDLSNFESDQKFCEVCGAPMTDEAVEMVMERLEALKDGKGD